MNPNCDTLSIFERAEMARRRGQRKGYLYEKSGWWMLRYRVDSPETDETGKAKRDRITVPIARAKGLDAVGKKEAQRIAWDEYLSKLDVMATRPSSMRTLREFIEQRFEPDVIATLKPGGRDHYKTILKNHVLPTLGSMRLRELSAAHVQAVLNGKLAKGLSTQTVTHIRNCISAVLRHAKAMQWFAGELPTEAVRLPEMKRQERRALTWEQVCAIAKNLPQPAATLVPFLALTGLRIGEAMGLRWKWVNLTDEFRIVDAEVIPPMSIAVRENFTRGSFQSLKTSNSSRNIPIQEWFAPQLLALWGASKFQAPDAPVFASPAGRPLAAHSVQSKQALKQAAAAAGMGTPAVPAVQRAKGVPPQKGKPAKSWVSWHCLRHTNATLADQIGLRTGERQKILGHGSESMTMHYTHADLELLRERWNRLADARKLLQ